MAGRTNSRKRRPAQPAEPGISGLTVAGFKSIRDEQSIEIRPLTLLAGANSSGKSSFMQPLLLLKQTLEASYDPGPLRLDGPNVRLTDMRQVLARSAGARRGNGFQVGMGLGSFGRLLLSFGRQAKGEVQLSRMIAIDSEQEITLTPGMSEEEIEKQLAEYVGPAKDLFTVSVTLKRERCFLLPVVTLEEGPTAVWLSFPREVISAAELLIRRVIHVPGLRGNPERTYHVTAVGDTYPGTFQEYVASVVYQWQTAEKSGSLEALAADLQELGLTSSVAARRVSDVHVELQVGRLARATSRASRDLVSIADVGLGVSQVLPVLVALHVATPRHLVYLEQPALHLHPRAQVALAWVLARAVKRGVRMVVETHSPLLLLAIQALVAAGKEGLTRDMVKLHWFTRSEKDGTSKITSADLDEAGSFGDWPEDFGAVTLDVEKEYLDAAERVWRRKK